MHLDFGPYIFSLFVYIVILLSSIYISTKTKPNIKQFYIDIIFAIISFIITHYFMRLLFRGIIGPFLSVPLDVMLEDITYISVLYFTLKISVLTILIPIIFLGIKKFIYQKFLFNTGNYYYLLGSIFSTLAYITPLYLLITYYLWDKYDCVFCVIR